MFRSNIFSMMRSVGAYGALVGASGIICTAEQLSSPLERLSINYDFGNKPVPKWEHGFLLMRQYDEYPATVLAFDRNGRTVRQANISFPDAVRVILRSAAAAPNGNIAVSGGAWTADGAFASFIAWINAASLVERVVRTEPFAAFRICFDDTGTLWAVGREHTADFRGEPQHNILRHYSSDGQLLESLLSRGSITSYNHMHPAEDAYLTASGDRVGLYSVPAREWIEISLSGAVLGRWNGLETTSDSRIVSAGLTSDGLAYVNVLPRNTASQAGTRPQLFLLDKSSGTWKPIDGTSLLGEIKRRSVKVLGSDGRQLVITAGLPELLWIGVQ